MHTYIAKVSIFVLALVPTFLLPLGGTDYRSSRISVFFNAEKQERLFTVIIYNDAKLEFSEYFFLDLEIPTAAAAYGDTKGSPDTAIVHVEDDGESCYK